MEKLIICYICFEEKDNIIELPHIDTNLNVSEHKICDDCYEVMTLNNKESCPFCRCTIIPKLNIIRKIPYIYNNLVDLNLVNDSFFSTNSGLSNSPILFREQNYNILRMRFGMRV